jgi:hypothetical protein
VGDSLSVLNGLLALAIGSVTVIFLSRQLYGPLRAVVVTPETNE